MAILNGFGRSLGDGIIGLQALWIALDMGCVSPDPVLFRLTGLPPTLVELYAAAPFCECRDLGWHEAAPHREVAGASEFARVLDLRDFALDPAFRGIAMIDFFLGRLGAEPARVPAIRRRNTWLADHVAPRPPPAAPGYVLVCPKASMTLRDMPDPVHANVLDCLREAGHPIVTQGPAPPGSGARHLPHMSALADLCGWVAAAALVVATDTAMVHLADAFGVPCVAVFTTHRPEWRVRDYPLCRALYRPPAGLPPALEFSRGPGDEAAVRAAWLDGGDSTWLTDAVTEALHDVRPGRA